MNSKLCPSTGGKVYIFMVFGDELKRCKGESEKMSNTAIARIIRRDKISLCSFSMPCLGLRRMNCRK